MYSHFVSCKAMYVVIMYGFLGINIAYGYKRLNMQIK